MDSDTGQMQQATALAACYATTCRWRSAGGCALMGLEIGKSGRCINYEELSMEQARKYMEERGISKDAIEHIMREAAKDGGAD